jgi:hypothetical protein
MIKANSFMSTSIQLLGKIGVAIGYLQPEYLTSTREFLLISGEDQH